VRKLRVVGGAQVGHAAADESRFSYQLLPTACTFATPTGPETAHGVNRVG